MSENNLNEILELIYEKTHGRLYHYKDYIFGLIFYKYLSEKIENYLNKELEEDNKTFKEAYNINEEYKELLEEESIENLGYFLEPEYLFKTIVEKAKIGEFILEDLEKALNKIECSAQGFESEDTFENIFEDVDLQSSKLGKTVNDKNEIISQIILKLSEINFKLDTENNIVENIYEYLIKEFSSKYIRKEEFCTPREVSKILAKIVTLNKTKIKKAYDPCCGSGSSLLEISKEAKIADFYGEEIDQTTYNLARINMIMHNISYEDFDIKRSNSLENPQFINEKFDVIVSQPPFISNWIPKKKFKEDPRFEGYEKLAPKSKASYAFIQHMIYHLSEDGCMAVLLPHGVLFREANEKIIRTHLIRNLNYLDAVIGLTENILNQTNISTVILVFKKSRQQDDNILFIDASEEYEKVTRRHNKLKPQDIEKIVNTYANREEIDKYSHKATLDEIEENDYNLNIPRYIDTYEEEEPVDLDGLLKEIDEVDEKIKKVKTEIREYYKELEIEQST